ncbi:hypothetical protein P308_10755 [Pseudomonas piscis]|nr:hypothetical protein P308_10755 [Pseudomonas piscis]
MVTDDRRPGAGFCLFQVLQGRQGLEDLGVVLVLLAQCRQLAIHAGAALLHRLFKLGPALGVIRLLAGEVLAFLVALDQALASAGS